LDERNRCPVRGPNRRRGGSLRGCTVGGDGEEDYYNGSCDSHAVTW
jgi:hypothetical protein